MAYTDFSQLSGPFDIIGDVHGCYDELVLILEALGYEINKQNAYHQAGRKLIFVGDLVDRGPKIVPVLRLVMRLVKERIAFCVQGNHDNKLYRKLSGRNVVVNNGLEASVMELAEVEAAFINEVKEFLGSLPNYLIFDKGKLVVAHAGIKAEYLGRTGKQVESFTLYGATTNTFDEYGLPVRADWAQDYRGGPLIVYGHTPHKEPVRHNNTLNIDTGCVFGNKLTAYRYPEDEFVFVNAKAQYASYPKPIE